jgi:hypothetical protein
VKFEVNLTFEVDDEREGNHRLDAIAQEAGAEIQSTDRIVEGPHDAAFAELAQGARP